MSDEKESGTYTRCLYCSAQVKTVNISKHTTRVHPGKKMQAGAEEQIALSHRAKHGAISKAGKWLLSKIGIALIGLFLGILLGVPLNPIIVPMIYTDTPNLKIDVYRDPTQQFKFHNGSSIDGLKWDSRFVLYLVSIQVQGSNHTPVDDVSLVFDFNASVLLVLEDMVYGATYATVTFPHMDITQNGTTVTSQRPSQFFVGIGTLDNDGLYALKVVIDPKYEGVMFRSILIRSESGYSGKFRYTAYGVVVTKEVEGSIPTTS